MFMHLIPFFLFLTLPHIEQPRLLEGTRGSEEQSRRRELHLHHGFVGACSRRVHRHRCEMVDGNEICASCERLTIHLRNGRTLESTLRNLDDFVVSPNHAYVAAWSGSEVILFTRLLR